MTGPGANEGELDYVDWDEPRDDYYFEEETEAEAHQRMTPEERQADLDWKQRWEDGVAKREIHDPFAD